METQPLALYFGARWVCQHCGEAFDGTDAEWAVIVHAHDQHPGLGLIDPRLILAMVCSPD